MSEKNFYIYENKRSKLFNCNPVLTVNGNSPDSTGAVTIDTGGTVKKVNGVFPNANGEVTINTNDAYYVTSFGTYSNNGIWYYRIWSNNFLEMWYVNTVDTNTNITFPYAFANTNYVATSGITTTGDLSITFSFNNKNTTYITLVPYDADGNTARTLPCYCYFAGFKS